MQEETQNVNDERELYENFRIEVEKGKTLLRIDKYLMSRIEGTSRNKIQTAAKADCIKVNDKPVKSNYRVKPGDVIQLFLTTPPQSIEIVPQREKLPNLCLFIVSIRTPQACFWSPKTSMHRPFLPNSFSNTV